MSGPLPVQDEGDDDDDEEAADMEGTGRLVLVMSIDAHRTDYIL